MQIEVPLQPKQKQLYEMVENSTATWIGFGGARGGSKSHAIRAIMLLRRLKYANTRGCIFRRTWDKLRENHIEPLFRQYPFMAEWYNSQNKEVTLPNKSVVAFRYAEQQKDMKQINSFIGKEYMDFFVDQAEMLTEKETLTLKTCTRWPGVPDDQCKFVASFNPGNVGHAFLKRIFYDKKYNEKERSQDYAFLQAFGWDNIEWSRTALKRDCISNRTYYHEWTEEQRFKYFIENSQTGRDLNALPQSMRIGWLLGSMDKFAGQYFDVFDPEVHVSPCHLEDWHSRWVGIDWGFGHNSAAHWFAQPEHRKTATYREFVANGRSPRALAQEICDRTPEDERKRIETIYLSHDAFAQRTEQKTISDQMGEVFKANHLPFPTMASKDVVGGATLIYDMLKNDEIAIDPCCVNLIETLPMITRDEDDLEKTVKFDGDDAYDSFRYGLKDRMRERQAPIEVRARNRVVEFATSRKTTVEEMDPTAVAMLNRRAINQARKMQRGRVHFPAGRVWHPRNQ